MLIGKKDETFNFIKIPAGVLRGTEKAIKSATDTPASTCPVFTDALAGNSFINEFPAGSSFSLFL